MTIDRQKGRLQLVCDVCECTHNQDYSKDEFSDMISDAKQDGWSVFVDDKHEWTHMCRSCRTQEIVA